jgi:cyclase
MVVTRNPDQKTVNFIWREIMEKRSVCIFGVVMSMLSPFLSAQEREIESIQFNAISDRLYEITGGRGARSGVYIGDDGVLVIDSKMDSASVAEIIQEIQKTTDKPIRYLINTHSDGDHTQGNRYFPKGILIISHENCRKEFFLPQRDGSSSEWNDPGLLSSIPSLTFRTQMQIFLGSKKVELYYFGTGHTTGDAVVYFPEERAAFIGDQVFLDRPQLIHAYKGGSSFGHIRNLTEMLQTLDAERFFSGHSEATDRAGIQNHIDEMKRRQSKIKDFIKAGKNVDEVIREFPENESNLIRTIFMEIKATD